MAQSTPSLKVDAMEVDNVETQNVTIGTDGDPSVNPKLHRGASGELEIVQGDDTTVEGTRSTNKAQINIKTAAIGTNATLTNNVKLHRGGNGEIGFVLADDTESEGSRSNNHALVQAKSVVLGDSPNQSFNVKMRRAGSGLIQFVLGDDGYSDGTLSPNYANLLGSVPLGSVVGWNPGYYLDGSNGAFVNASFLTTNSIAGANAYLNPAGYWVADGSAPAVAGSLIWNAAGRYLPNLSDDRFLMGSTSAGTAGGSNTMLDHTHTDTLVGDSHTHTIDHTHATGTASSAGAHTHIIGDSFNAHVTVNNSPTGSASGVIPRASGSNTPSQLYALSDGAHTHPITIPAYSGGSGGAGVNISGTVGTGSAATATDWAEIQ